MLEGQFVDLLGPAAFAQRLLHGRCFAQCEPYPRLRFSTAMAKKMLSSGLALESGLARNSSNVSDGVTLGAAPTNLYAWEGDIAEALVFDRELTPAEMQTTWDAPASALVQPPPAEVRDWHTSTAPDRPCNSPSSSTL